MPPLSSRAAKKQAEEAAAAAATVAVDPLCKHHHTVPPSAVGAFTLDGNRITTPSGAYLHEQQQLARQTSSKDSTASRACRSLVDGGVILTTTTTAAAAAADSCDQANVNAPVQEQPKLWTGSVHRGASSSVASAVASQRLDNRAQTAPAPPGLTKKSDAPLSQFVNEHNVFTELPRFVSQANALNASNVGEKERALSSTSNSNSFLKSNESQIKETLKKGIASSVPNMMRYHFFDEASSWNDFPRYTVEMPNRKNRDPKQRAAAFVSALLKLKNISDSHGNSYSLIQKQQQQQEEAEDEERFAFHKTVCENYQGISSTFRLAITPRPCLRANFDSQENEAHYGREFFACNVIDSQRPFLLHSSGYYWKVNVASTHPASPFCGKLQSSISVLEQFEDAFSLFEKDQQQQQQQQGEEQEGENNNNNLPARKNDVDFASLSRCHAIDCVSVLSTVSQVCKANFETLKEAFSCFLSVSLHDGEGNEHAAQHSFEGECAFAPISLGVNTRDGSIAMTWNCAFINDAVAAACSEWVVHVADNDDDFFDGADLFVHKKREERQQEREAAKRAELEQIQLQKEKEASEIAAVANAAATAAAGGGGGARRTSGRRNSGPSGGGGGGRAGAETPSSATAATPPPQSTQPQTPEPLQTAVGGTLVEVVRTKLPGSHNSNNNALESSLPGSPTSVRAGGGGRQTSSRGVTPGAGGGGGRSIGSAGASGGAGDSPLTRPDPNILERVTVVVPDPSPAKPELLSIWIPRTIQVPPVEPHEHGQFAFTVTLREPRSLYFAAALALWDDKALTPPDVMKWKRSRSGVEPLLYLCRSDDIDRFLHAARSSGQPSLGPHHHDLKVLFNKALNSVEELSGNNNSNKKNNSSTSSSNNNNAPFVSIVAAMLSLKLLNKAAFEKVSHLARFGNPSIVVSSTPDKSDASCDSLHTPLTPPPGLFSSNIDVDRNSCELQYSVLPHHASSGKKQRTDGKKDVRCVLSVPYSMGGDEDGVEDLAKFIAGFALTVDSYC